MGIFLEDVFKQSPSVIFRYDMFGVFTGKGCDRTKDEIGNRLGKFPVYDNVSLIRFSMEEFIHRREQEVKKGFGWIKMA